MNTTQLDRPSFARSRRPLPKQNRKALWKFRIDEDEFTCWGTMREALSTARFYAMIEEVPNSSITLVDYVPLPRVHTVYNSPEG